MVHQAHSTGRVTCLIVLQTVDSVKGEPERILRGSGTSPPCRQSDRKTWLRHGSLKRVREIRFRSDQRTGSQGSLYGAYPAGQGFANRCLQGFACEAGHNNRSLALYGGYGLPNSGMGARQTFCSHSCFKALCFNPVSCWSPPCPSLPVFHPVKPVHCQHVHPPASVKTAVPVYQRPAVEG